MELAQGLLGRCAGGIRPAPTQTKYHVTAVATENQKPKIQRDDMLDHKLLKLPALGIRT